jgi:SAM-dependent methyltransferase
MPTAPATGDARRFAPAAARNRGPILEVLREVLPETGTVLEIASGTGEHAVAFAAELTGLRWIPTDPDPASRASIKAWIEATGIRTVCGPLDLDVAAADWGVAAADAIVCINMIHIAPWSACEGLMAGAGRLLRAGAPLCLYGPYKRGGVHTAPSNEAFDADLRSRNPAWGVRDLEEVADLAARHGFTLERVAEMPANNLTVVFRKG